MKIRVDKVCKHGALLAFVFALALATGCASYEVRTFSLTGRAATYPGTRYDAALIAHPSTNGEPVFNITFGVLDIVPSALADTILLPHDLNVEKSASK